MARNDNSKERIKFACKELEDALVNFEAETSKSNELEPCRDLEATDKISEIKRQLQNIRRQLDSLSR